MTPSYRYFSLTVLLVCMLLASCSSQPDLPRGQSIPLTSFTDSISEVSVSVRLQHAEDGTFLMLATFTPPEGYHLYSKDIPITGVRGQGRPTLIELPADAKTQPAGALSANVSAALPGYVPDGAPVYPEGPVTLTLPVQLPDQTGWVKDQISLTYMACTPTICTAPTVRKLVEVSIPGAQSITP